MAVVERVGVGCGFVFGSDVEIGVLFIETVLYCSFPFTVYEFLASLLWLFEAVEQHLDFLINAIDVLHSNSLVAWIAFNGFGPVN
jgi:uncharacterized membrane protein required for colicin V production